MQDLITAPVSMTSKRIAELTGKKHYTVLRDIRTAIAQLEQAARYKSVSSTNFPQPVLDKNGNTAYYDCSEDFAVFMLTGYNAVARWTLIQEFKHIKQQNQQLLLEAYTKAERARLTEQNKRMIAEEETGHLLMKLNAVGKKRCRICGEVVHNKDFYHDSRQMCKRCARYLR